MITVPKVFTIFVFVDSQNNYNNPVGIVLKVLLFTQKPYANEYADVGGKCALLYTIRLVLRYRNLQLL